MAQEINLFTNFFQNIIKNKKGNLLKKSIFKNLLILLKKGINNKDFGKKIVKKGTKTKSEKTC